MVAKDASALGIMQINSERRIVRFVEKPKDPAVLDSLKLDRTTYGPLGIQSSDDLYLASMGIYVFNREVLFELLNNNLTDFGKHIIPGAIEDKRLFSYVYQGYWEDIGTIRSFFEANLDQAANMPKFNFFDPPVYTRPRFLPASKVNAAAIEHAVISDGCVISQARVQNSVIGVRSVLDEGSFLSNVVMMGADYYDTPARRSRPENLGIPLGIGRGSRDRKSVV